MLQNAKQSDALPKLPAGGSLKHPRSRPRHLLVIDGAYTWRAMQQRGTTQAVIARDLEGFFEHVWSVNPLAGFSGDVPSEPSCGPHEAHRVSTSHTVIEARRGRFRWLAFVAPVNFLLGQLSLLASLARLIRVRQIDVIRAGDPLYLGLFGLALSRICRVPLAIRVNGNNDKLRAATRRPMYPRLLRSNAVERAIERFVFPRAALVAAANEDNRSYAIAAGAAADRTTVFRYGNLLAEEHLRDPVTRQADHALFDRLGISPNEYLLVVGRLEPLKMPDDTIRALDFLTRMGVLTKLVFVGDGAMRPALERLAVELDLAAHVVFAGLQDQATIAQLNTFAGVVLSPITGRALAESALCGAPVVAYDVDWQSEIIADGQTGRLVALRDWRSMANVSARLLRDRNYARRLGAAARSRAMELLDPAMLNEHERKAYRAIIDDDVGSRARYDDAFATP